jgi:hypothetical protein
MTNVPHINPIEPNQCFAYGYMNIANEYYALSHKHNLSDKEATRLGKILEFACDSDDLSLIIHEINEIIFQETGIEGELNTHRHCDQRARVSELTGYKVIGGGIPVHRLVFEHASLNLMTYEHILTSYYRLLRLPVLLETDQHEMSLILEEAVQDGLLGLLLGIENQAFIEQASSTIGRRRSRQLDDRAILQLHHQLLPGTQELSTIVPIGLSQHSKHHSKHQGLTITRAGKSSLLACLCLVIYIYISPLGKVLFRENKPSVPSQAALSELPAIPQDPNLIGNGSLNSIEAAQELGHQPLSQSAYISPKKLGLAYGDLYTQPIVAGDAGNQITVEGRIIAYDNEAVPIKDGFVVETISSQIPSQTTSRLSEAPLEYPIALPAAIPSNAYEPGLFRQSQPSSEPSSLTEETNLLETHEVEPDRWLMESLSVGYSTASETITTIEPESSSEPAIHFYSLTSDSWSFVGEQEGALEETDQDIEGEYNNRNILAASAQPIPTGNIELPPPLSRSENNVEIVSPINRSDVERAQMTSADNSAPMLSVLLSTLPHRATPPQQVSSTQLQTTRTEEYIDNRRGENEEENSRAPSVFPSQFTPIAEVVTFPTSPSLSTLSITDSQVESDNGPLVFPDRSASQENHNYLNNDGNRTLTNPVISAPSAISETEPEDNRGLMFRPVETSETDISVGGAVNLTATSTENNRSPAFFDRTSSLENNSNVADGSDRIVSNSATSLPTITFETKPEDNPSLLQPVETSEIVFSTGGETNLPTPRIQDDIYYRFNIDSYNRELVVSSNLQSSILLTSNIVPFDGPSIADTEEPDFYDLLSDRNLRTGVNFPFLEDIVLELGYTSNNNELNFTPSESTNNTSYIARLNLLTDGILDAAVTYISSEKNTSNAAESAPTRPVSFNFGNISLGGYYTSVNNEISKDLSAYGGGVAVSNFLETGNEFGIYGGVQPEQEDRGPLIFEAYYKMNVNEFFTFTPSVVYADDPNADDGDNLYGALRASFQF